MHHDVWLIERNFFYWPQFNGLSITKASKYYARFLLGVESRSDLSYLLHDMLGDLTVSHMFLEGSRHPNPKAVSIGLFDAEEISSCPCCNRPIVFPRSVQRFTQASHWKAKQKATAGCLLAVALRNRNAVLGLWTLSVFLRLLVKLLFATRTAEIESLSLEFGSVLRIGGFHAHSANRISCRR